MVDRENENRELRDSAEVRDVVKGVVIGIATALAVGGIVAILTSRHRTYRDSMKPKKRVENYAHDDDGLGEVPSHLGDSGSGIVDTIRSVNDALDTGRQAMETLQSVIGNIRGR